MHRIPLRLQIVGMASLIGSIAQANDAVQIDSHPKVGAIHVWSERSRLVSTYLPVGFETTIEEQVVSVESDGSFVVNVVQGKTFLNWAGEELASPDEPVLSSYRCNARGEIVEAKADPIYFGWFARAHDLETVVAPDGPVHVGESWSFDFKSNSKTGAVAAHGNYQLSSITVDPNYGEVYSIRLDVHETEGVAPASSVGTIVIRKSDGEVLSSEFKLDNAAVPGIPGLASGTRKVSLTK